MNFELHLLDGKKFIVIYKTKYLKVKLYESIVSYNLKYIYKLHKKKL